MPEQTLLQFQNEVWEGLPKRKHLAGKEKVFDIVSVVVQEWPFSEQDADPKADKTSLLKTTRTLTKSVKRHLQLLYGDAEFGSVWIVLLQIVVSEIVRYILTWWLREKKHSRRLVLWRRNWIDPKE